MTDLRFKYRDGTVHNLAEVAKANGLSPLEFALVGYLEWCATSASVDELLGADAIVSATEKLRAQAAHKTDHCFRPTIEELQEKADWAERYVETLLAVPPHKRQRAVLRALKKCCKTRWYRGIPGHVQLVEVTRGCYRTGFAASFIVPEQRAVYISILRAEAALNNIVRKEAYERLKRMGLR